MFYRSKPLTFPSLRIRNGRTRRNFVENYLFTSKMSFVGRDVVYLNVSNNNSKPVLMMKIDGASNHQFSFKFSASPLTPCTTKGHS
jgi:hypothetical protein